MFSDNLYTTKIEISEQIEMIFESYRNYLYNEYKITGIMDYKNILLTSVLNRSLALMEAYKTLLLSNNIMTLNSLTRLQLDNCIFVHGIYLLINNGSNIDEIGSSIIKKNKKLSSYYIGKEQLFDSYLIDKIDKKYNNRIKKMYEFYCRFVHFSDSALLSSSQALENNVLSIEFSKDYSRFERDVITNANSFIDLCKFLLILIKDEWKDIPNGRRMNK